MCTGMEIAAIVGSGAQLANQQYAQRKQDKAIVDTIRASTKRNRQAGERVGEAVDEVKKSGPDAEREASQAGFMDALRRAELDKGFETQGNVSDRFASDVNAARRGAGASNRNAAALQARIDAPMLQRQREATQLSNAAVDLDLLRGQTASDNFLANLRASMIQPNAGIDAAGQFIGGYADAASRRMPSDGRPRGPRTVDSTIPYYGPPRSVDSDIPGG